MVAIAGADIERGDSPGPLQHQGQVAVTDKGTGRQAQMGETQGGDQNGHHALEGGHQGRHRERDDQRAQHYGRDQHHQGHID